MASFENLCAKKNLNFDDYWAADAEGKTEIYHFIGKDIVYFHALFWPYDALLGVDVVAVLFVEL